MSLVSRKFCIQEGIHDLNCQARAYHTAAHGQNIGIIVLSRRLRAEAVAAKRRAEVVSLTEELAACVPGADGGREQEMRELGALLSDFLRSLPQESRLFFLRRYWFMDSVKEIAARYAVGESRVKTSLFRTRRKLRDYLEKEGISV